MMWTFVTHRNRYINILYVHVYEMLWERCLFFVLNCYIEKKNIRLDLRFFWWKFSTVNLDFILFYFTFLWLLGVFKWCWSFWKYRFSKYSLISVFLTGAGSASSPSQLNCLKASYPLSFSVLKFVPLFKPTKRPFALVRRSVRFEPIH